jgi:hypothetical protein
VGANASKKNWLAIPAFSLPFQALREPFWE